jgi:hypothetical protein
VNRFLIKNGVLLDYYVASSGNLLPTFRDHLSIPPSGFKNPKQSLLPQYGIYIVKSVDGEVSVVWCQPVGLMQVVGTEGSVVVNSILGLQAFVWIPEPLGRYSIDRSESAVTNYHYSLRNNPEDRTSRLLRGGSLKLRFVIMSRRTVRLVFKRLGVLLYTITLRLTYH